MTRAAPEPILLDLTRLVARSWTGRQPTGIDRVCAAYLQHFGKRARAVVQHRGVIRVLSERDSAALHDELSAPQEGSRGRLVRRLSAALLNRDARDSLRGRAYLNVGDTDFDLPAHHRWIRQQGLRAFYFLHDLIPALHPEFSRPHAVRRHRGRVHAALAQGAGIILGTATVRRELEAYAAAQDLPLPPLAVAHLAGADLGGLAPPPGRDVADPYFLCLGTIEPRKNHRLLFAVWERLVARLGAGAPRLVLVGQTGPLTGDLLAPLARLGGHIEHRAACTDAELSGLVNHARALLVPSLAEGFGLPVVEALQVGTPVIASALPVFGEIGQGAAMLLDPHDAGAWEQAIVAAAGAPSGPAHTATAFVPPRWQDHFAIVERFIANPVPQSRPASKRVLAA